MRNIVFIVIAFVLSFSGRVCAGNPVYSDNSLRNDAEKLLVEWVDALLAYQCEGLHPSLDGGILCPACARIHGRIGDISACRQETDEMDGERAPSGRLLDERCARIGLERNYRIRRYCSVRGSALPRASAG